MSQEKFAHTPAGTPCGQAENELRYNVATALGMLQGDVGLLEELALLFLTETPARLDQLRAALTAKDNGHIHRTAHAIKGSLGAIGALQVMATANALESAARLANWPQINILTQRFEAEYNQLCTELQQIFGA